MAALAGASVGCVSAYARSVERAEAAEAAGDLRAAVLSYRAACGERAPSEACDEARRVERRYRDQAAREAEPHCKEGTLAACAAALADARETMPGDPALMALADAAGERHAAACWKWSRSPGPLDEAIRWVACLAPAEPLVDTPSFATALRGARRDAAARFVAAADAEGVSASSGARATLLTIAREYDSSLRSLEAPARSRFVREHAVPIWIHLESEGARLSGDVLCSQVARAVGEQVQCRSGSSFVVPITVWLDAPQHSTSSHRNTKRYQSGVRHIENPAHFTAHRRFEEAQRAVKRIELDEAEARSRCELREKELFEAKLPDKDDARRRRDRACERHRTVEEVTQRRRDELDHARRRMNDEPALIEEPVFDIAEWIEVRHLWSAPYELEVAGVAHRGNAIVRGVESGGHGAAGVPAKHLRPPSPQDFERQVAHAILARAKDHIVGAVRDRGRQVRNACPESTPRWEREWLECWSRATLWETGTIDPKELLVAVASGR